MSFKHMDWTGNLRDYETIDELLVDARVIGMELVDGRLVLTEACDDYYTARLSKIQVEAWIDELTKMKDRM